eukprot:3543145-Rhodomonas_salina.1
MKKIGMGSRAPNGDGGYDVVAGDERHARQHLPGSTQPRVSSILVRVGAFEWGAAPSKWTDQVPITLRFPTLRACSTAVANISTGHRLPRIQWYQHQYHG